MARPATIAIVGRPNVGKSTLFNRLVGKRLALVDDQPGVTRDRREGDGKLLGLEFIIVDTAGFEDYDAATLPGRMRVQTEKAVRGADAALFMVDARDGVTPLDEEIARWLRSEDTPIILCCNKAEGRQGENGVMEAYSLGFGEPIALSAEHGGGLVELFQALAPIVDPFMEAKAQADAEAEALALAMDEEDEGPRGPLKLAIVGRPNAGKSTLINRIIGEDRLITGPEAGITRDSIRVEWLWENDGESHEIQLFDTAGMRKRAKVHEKLEKLSVADALHAIDFAEVVVLLLDATKGLEAQDLRIADRVLDEGRALIIALNKWDVAEDPSSLFNGVRGALEDGLSQIKGVPLLSVSGATGKGLDLLIRVAFEQRHIWASRVPTGKLNRWFEAAVANNPPPAPGGRRIKLRYITQARTRPPTFVVFGTRTDELPASYHRYLSNGMRKELGFQGVPMRMNFRNSKNPFDED
jgi:GTP-binding protein